MKKIITTLCVALALSACNTTKTNETPSAITNLSPKDSSLVLPKNIIMVIGDGMGPAYTTAYRYFNDDPTTQVIEETVFDRHLVGMSSTYPAHVSEYK